MRVAAHKIGVIRLTVSPSPPLIGPGEKQPSDLRGPLCDHVVIRSL
ncbi:hypothetical protein LAUMK41_03817 [Mycobacterium attenuatum]|nr:hypothetical protein LAUMK41_03817 [Mycobacterium attenuatum]